MATLVHDDLIDGAEVRRGRASVWSAHGVDVARATGDYLFARAFAELAAGGNLRAVQILADAALCLVRGETMQRRQRHDAETTVDAYIERCALKTAKLFEAACVLGGGESLREFGANLGIVFQIVDDILDCTGQTIETGKVAGTDLRDGTPTLPLILGSQQDAVVHRALAGGPQEEALVRVAECGALEQSREIALEYAARARGALERHAPQGARGARDRGPGAAELTSALLRLGRISYVNMAPVFFRLDAEVDEVHGVPTALNEQLLAGELDIAPISSIEYARNADRLRILPRLCVSSEGAVDSIQLVSKKPLEHVRTVAVTPESATSVVLTKVLLPEATHVPLGEPGDATLLIGDAALKSAFEDPTPHYDLGRLWLERTGLPMVFAVWATTEPVPEECSSCRRRSSRRCAPRAATPRRSRSSRRSATATRRGSSRATSRSCATRSGRASARDCCRSSSSRTKPASSTGFPSCASSRPPKLRSDTAGKLGARMGRLKLASVLSVTACVFAVVASAALAASISVAPSSVHRGHRVIIRGNAAPCPVGSGVFIISRAFAHTHDFAGVPAVIARVRCGRQVRDPAEDPEHEGAGLLQHQRPLRRREPRRLRAPDRRALTQALSAAGRSARRYSTV